MRKLIIPMMLATTVALGACNTVRGLGSDIQSVANALDPRATYPVCGTYGAIDRDRNGYISSTEWSSYRAGAFTGWDLNRDGRISQNEFGSCWYGGGFYTGYDRSAWVANFRAFDANRDGYLSRSEFFSGNAWARMDRNRNGRIDANEWRW